MKWDYYLYQLIVLNLDLLIIGRYVLGLKVRKGLMPIVAAVVAGAEGMLLYYINVEPVVIELVWCMTFCLIAYRLTVLSSLRTGYMMLLFLTALSILAWTIIRVIPNSPIGVIRVDVTEEYIPGIAVVIVLILLSIIVRIKRVTVNEYFQEMKLKEKALMLLTLSMDIFLTSFLQGSYWNEMTPNLRKWMVVFSVIVLFLTVVVFFYLGIISRRDAYERRIHKLEEDRFETVMNSYDAYRKFRHDSREHLQALSVLAREENAEKVAEYLDRISEGGAFDPVTHMGDQLIDALYRDVFGDVLRDDSWSFVVRGRNTNHLQMDEYDKCTVFSNLFRNAREAMDKAPEHNLFIEIRENDEETNFIIENSKQDEKVDIERSSKNDVRGHGIGIGNVREVIRKNNAEVTWEDKGKTMRVEMYIPSKML